ncbi:Vitellogenin-2 [Lucilia cuprina]|nr:Vitellogenin-2 [Lucilia cuprina]
MMPLRSICLLIGFLALATANSMNWQSSRNSIKNSMKPTDWLSSSELESLPSLNEISLKKLESMSVDEGADMLNKLYHLAQVNEEFQPSFSPKPSEIQTHLITPNNQKISFKLNELPKIAKEAKNFGDQEVTIFITGLPQKTERIKKATRKLVQAYINPSSSEEDYSTSWKSKSNKPDGNLVIIDLGSSLPNFKAYATLDIEETGDKIGDILVQLTDKADVPQEIIHVIGSNIAAHESQSLTGLARGDAEFVDAIHTSAYGMDIAIRCGDADFDPDGPTAGVSGSHNVVEASMRAVRYFAESVVPGNFPAEAAISLKVYKNHNISGKRVYMGITTEQDIEGDFVLQVNAKTPFGRRAPAQRQLNYVRHNLAHQGNDQNKRFLGVISLVEHFG